MSQQPPEPANPFDNPPPPPQFNQGFEQQQFKPPRSKPDNNLVWVILATVMCCVPLGIPGILQATKVDSLWAQGQYDAAEEAAQKAKNWAIAAAVTGAIGGFLYLMFYMAMLGSM